MNIYAAPAGTTAARRAEAENGAAPAAAQEIKYRQDAASYVAAMLAELRQIAGNAGFDKLVTSLDTAYYEAYGALDAKAREAVPASPGEADETLRQRASNATGQDRDGQPGRGPEGRQQDARKRDRIAP